LFLSEVLSPLQSLGVCLTLVSIYLINQREEIASKLQSIVHRPSAAQTQLLLEETLSQINPLSEESRPVTLASMPVKITESEAELLQNQ
jgi:hypothetical protein